MARALYLSHPQVNISADIPVPNWSLSETGMQRVLAVSGRDWVSGVDQIVTSHETKAIETAQVFANALKLDPIVAENMGENDRTSTGFLPPDQFEHAADCFMNAPEKSYQGWERAVDAQARIVAAVKATLRNLPGSKTTLFVGHGGVGTLLKCHIASRNIMRSEDQPANGGGNLFAFDLETKTLLCDWTPMEEFSGFSS